MIYKKIALMALGVFMGVAAKTNIFLQPRLSIGPAYHSFSTKQLFDTTFKGFFIEILEREFEHLSIYSQWAMMPYAQAQLKGLIGNHFNLLVSAGVGSFKRGRTIVNHSASFNNNFYFIAGKREALTCGSVTIVDVGIGTLFDVPYTNFLQVNPVLGYRYNMEKLHLNSIFPVESYKIRNKWQGPYIGAQFSIDFFDTLFVVPSYKFVMSKLQYLLQFFRSGGIYNILPKYSIAEIPAHGNIFNIDLVYQYNKNINFGMSVDYMQYATTCSKNAKFPKTVLLFRPEFPIFKYEITVNKETINYTVWQQLIWTFFMEACY